MCDDIIKNRSDEVSLSPLSALQLLSVPSSRGGATLLLWNTTSVNWNGCAVKSWWCNILAENSVSINRPEKLNGCAVLGSLHSPRSPVVRSLNKCACASAVAINTGVAASRTRVTPGSGKTNWASEAGCNWSREDAAALRESADQRGVVPHDGEGERAG